MRASGRFGQVGSFGVLIAMLVLSGCASSTSGGNSSPPSTSSTQSTSGGSGSSSGAGGASGLHFMLDGTYMGQSVKGSVTPGSLQCIPITTGGQQGLQLNWSGTVPGPGQVSGDMMFAGGSTSMAFGTAGSQGEASLVVKGDYSNRYGASSALGSGNASRNASNNSGTIDAMLDGGSAGTMHLSGSWTC